MTPNSPSSSPAPDSQEWRLASTDPRDPGQHKYRLHTLDIYFWTQEDAKGVIGTFRRLLRPQQLDILDEPRKSSHTQDSVSPVVQQLENVAITDPAYGNGQTRNSQNQATPIPPAPPQSLANSRHSPSSLNGSAARTGSVKSNEGATDFAPMAYNPAAPAAPEPIAHREKTPPPADATEGTGLAAAAYADHNQAYPGNHPQAYPGMPGQPYAAPGHYGSPPPQQGLAHYGSPPPQTSYGSPPPAQPFQHTPSVTSATSSQRTSMPGTHAAPPSTATSPPPVRQPSISQPAFAPPPQDPNAHLYSSNPGAPSQLGFAPPPPQDPNAQFYPSQTHSATTPLESPSTQLYGSIPQHPHQPLPHLQPQYADYLSSRPQPPTQPQPPVGGYSQYSYAHRPPPPPPQHPHGHHGHHHHHDEGANRYDVHNQLYRPTEEEDRHKHRKSSAGQNKPPVGRLEETAGKVDKKVGGFLKRLEKRL